jgi:hypothetical protein
VAMMNVAPAREQTLTLSSIFYFTEYVRDG